MQLKVGNIFEKMMLHHRIAFHAGPDAQPVATKSFLNIKLF